MQDVQEAVVTGLLIAASWLLFGALALALALAHEPPPRNRIEEILRMHARDGEGR